MSGQTIMGGIGLFFAYWAVVIIGVIALRFVLEWLDRHYPL